MQPSFFVIYVNIIFAALKWGKNKSFAKKKKKENIFLVNVAQKMKES